MVLGRESACAKVLQQQQGASSKPQSPNLGLCGQILGADMHGRSTSQVGRKGPLHTAHLEMEGVGSFQQVQLKSWVLLLQNQIREHRYGEQGGLTGPWPGHISTQLQTPGLGRCKDS